MTIQQVTPRLVTLFLAGLTPAVAKTCRGVLRQALTYAVANGVSAPTINGTFGMLSQRIESGHIAPTSPTVAITKTQAAKVIADLKADEKTSKMDLPDAVVLADLAVAHLGHGDVDHACAIAIEAVDRLRQAGYATGVDRLRALRTRLSPWATSKAVRDLDQHLALAA